MKCAATAVFRLMLSLSSSAVLCRAQAQKPTAGQTYGSQYQAQPLSTNAQPTASDTPSVYAADSKKLRRADQGGHVRASSSGEALGTKKSAAEPRTEKSVQPHTIA